MEISPPPLAGGGREEGALPQGAEHRPAWRIGAAKPEAISPAIAQEVPVALVYNGLSHVVMLASPTDLDALALGFSLSEGLLQHPGELLDLEIAEHGGGIELRLQVTARRFQALKDRRRNLMGRTGCGLCGVESLADATRDLVPVPPGFTVEVSAIRRALAHLGDFQAINRVAGAVHAAAWVAPDGEILCVAEDVGRHNAFDKVIGLMAGRPEGRPEGFALLTSRMSFELVQKAATMAIPVLVAISAPTSLALDAAEAAGIGIVALARADNVTIYANPWRFADLEPLSS